MKSDHYSKKKSWIWAFILILLSTKTSSAQEIIPLQRALDIALKNNLQIKRAQLNEALADETLKQSKWALYPTLNGSSGLNFNHGRSINPTSNGFIDSEITSSSFGLTAKTPLFMGFQRINQIAANKYSLEANKSGTQKAKNDLILNVLTTYLQVLTSQDLLLAAKQQLDYSHQQLDREQKCFDVGNKTGADLSQAKAQVATAELKVTKTQNDLDVSLLTLAQFMERDPTLPFGVEKPVVEAEKAAHIAYSATDIYRTALSNFPEIKQAESNSMARYKEISLAKGGLYPQISLQGGLNTGYSNAGNQIGSLADGSPLYANAAPFRSQLNTNFSQTIGASVSVPIFNGLSARSSIRTAKVKYEDAKVSEQLAKNNLNKIINQAVLDVRAAEKKYASTQAAYAASKDAFDATEKRHAVGLVNTLDYNKAQTDLNNAQFETIKAEYDLMLCRQTIDFYLGKCLVSDGCK